MNRINGDQINNRILIGPLEPFLLRSSWTSYRKRLDCFFKANHITDNKIKKAAMLTMIGGATYEIILSLFTPANLDDYSYNKIVQRLDAHFSRIQICMNESSFGMLFVLLEFWRLF